MSAVDVADPAALLCAPQDDLVTVHPVEDLHRRFLDDPELVAYATTLSEARALVMGACVPRSVRRELAPIVDQLGQLLHGRPYLEAAG